MKSAPRYLTKSRFALAMECPAKLYYTGKASYANRKLDDPFLNALAEGGFQVGELARRYFPGGTLIDETRHKEAEEMTAGLMKRDSVTLFEPAFRFANLFIRADILVKEGNSLQLIEVKAKSFDPCEDDPFFTKKGDISSGWKSYLYDVAFQTHVLKNVLPGFTVEPFLMMADKSARCPTDGLNQKLRIRRGKDERKRVEIYGELTPEDLNTRILVQVPVGECVDAILGGNVADFSNGFSAVVTGFADAYAKDRKLSFQPGGRCRDCEFRATPEDEKKGLLCGFRECWKEAQGLEDADFSVPSVLDVWNYRKKDKAIAEGCWRMTDITDEFSSLEGDGLPGLTPRQRQWTQIFKVTSHDDKPYLDNAGLKSEMESWKFPLHFIDFETAMTAVPFNSGRRPYEGIAFQFSHHVVEKDGSVRHEGQYLETTTGVFPNYAFARALKKQLDRDEGTIFRYAAHENTYLKMIVRQMDEDPDPPTDRVELAEFIGEITCGRDEKGQVCEGQRNMVDMLKLVKRHYYDPAMGGSNSIKYVLPAILNSSPFLENKYSEPVYGASGGIRSLNFKDWCWVRREGGRIRDPYKLLPRLFEDLDPEETEKFLSQSDELREGGAAMTAWALMQFSDMSAIERQKISEALLKYCELDTLAMVMIYEGWKEMLA
ncbi:MAG: DUF2779 domain-containing protein [Thermovirgaceae bacterium]|nr:DUF2779 domain-containing protein [Thermovirgaceae bacterium]